MYDVLFLYANILSGEFYFRNSKEPRETCVIKLSRKFSILQYYFMISTLSKPSKCHKTDKVLARSIIIASPVKPIQMSGEHT